MSDILTRIKNQHDFPKEDLSSTNAEFLSLMLANSMLLDNGHAYAEKSYPIFTGTHKPLMIAAENIFGEPDKTMAINLGIKAFEAITLFVSAWDVSLRADLIALERNINGMVKPANAESVCEYFEAAQGNFRERMPRTAYVIRETSERFVGSASLAVLGGAIAYQFEIDNLED